jgi:Rad3-related DNA helicase
MIKNTHYADFFPYPQYRVAQESIIKKIEKNARLKKNLLLVAPYGTGKTVMALSGLLPVALEKGLKIIYTCRTHIYDLIGNYYRKQDNPSIAIGYYLKSKKFNAKVKNWKNMDILEKKIKELNA